MTKRQERAPELKGGDRKGRGARARQLPAAVFQIVRRKGCSRATCARGLQARLDIHMLH